MVQVNKAPKGVNCVAQQWKQGHGASRPCQSVNQTIVGMDNVGGANGPHTYEDCEVVP